MDAVETALEFALAGERCVGILHGVAHAANVGVLVIVGGPQYRVGSHRQFVLLARALAAGGVPVLRFDYRGLGDSDGEARDFEHVGDDIRAAVDALIARSSVRRVVLWGLCDAASAAMMYAATDQRVGGLVVLNPWVHTPTTEAQVRLKTYYLTRLRSPELWRKLLHFEFDWRGSLASLTGYIAALSRPTESASQEHFIERMRTGWSAFKGPSLLILSGDDFTAGEFRELVQHDDAWRDLLASETIESLTMLSANHTFARAEWRDEVAQRTLAWVLKLHQDFQRRGVAQE